MEENFFDKSYPMRIYAVHMDATTVILVCSLVAGCLMAFSLGANDAANSMAAAVGAKAITIKQAVIIAALLNFLGSVFLGSHVAATVATGIVDASRIPDQTMLMLGMFSALLSSGLWVLVATFTALPVSSTHAVIGGIIGMGLVVGGPEAVHWGVLLGIAGAWIISPFFGGLIAYLAFTHIRETILYKKDMLAGAKRWVPFWLAFTLVIIVLSLMFKTPMGHRMNFSWWHGAVATAVIAVIFIGLNKFLWPVLFSNKKLAEKRSPQQVEEVFRRMQIGMSCYVSMAHGASDVSNAIGPVAAIYLMARQQNLTNSVDIPIWLLALGGVGIAFGVMLLGHKVMDTVGARITKMNNSRGFAVSFGAATTVLLASNMGLPVSSTHAAVGAVAGVGMARGFAAVDFRVLGRIVLYWVLTIPIAAISCVIIFSLLRLIFF